VAISDVIAERARKTGVPQCQTNDRLHHRPELINLVTFFRQSASDYMAALKYKSTLELRLQGCWASILRGVDRFELHEHANSFLSGSFYLDADSNSQPIRFWDPRPQARVHDLPVDVAMRINRRYFEIEATNGRLVLFPSWLAHWVRPSMSDVPRTSVSFNLTLHGEVGSEEHLTRAVL
jgi:uncharacterized protein (TIGR02466 family)